MSSIQLPKLLYRANQDALNKTLLEKTGCFLFLRTDDVFPGAAPNKPYDAFVEIVVGLYVVYHDFACRFWETLLGNNLLPSGIQAYSLNTHKKHIQSINKTLRQQIAHGSLKARSSEADPLRDSLEELMQSSSHTPPWAPGQPQWPKYMNDMGEDDWCVVVERLTKRSDSLISFFEGWAAAWERDINSDNSKSPRASFSYDGIWNSIDHRCVAPYEEANGIKLTDDQMDDLRNHLIGFFTNNTSKTNSHLLKEMASWIRKLSMPASPSTSIAGKYGFGIS